ncbi:MAG: hypothetical protein U0746_06900 [Gemmataceae bacterium]
MVWQAADPAEREVIERMVLRVVDRLSTFPYSQGESRPKPDARLLFELPVVVEYRIERFGGIVLVPHVRYVPNRPRT